MIYIDLSVNSLEETIEFYRDRLRFFEFEATRLICNLGVDLILDPEEVGTDRHFERFGQREHAPASVWIHVGGESQQPELEVLERLRASGISFSNTENLGGHYLGFVDPSGNKFTVHSHLGHIK